MKLQVTVGGSSVGPDASLRPCVGSLQHFFPISPGHDCQVLTGFQLIAL